MTTTKTAMIGTLPITLDGLPVYVDNRPMLPHDLASGVIVSIDPRIEHGKKVGWDLVPATQEMVDRVLESNTKRKSMGNSIDPGCPPRRKRK